MLLHVVWSGYGALKRSIPTTIESLPVLSRGRRTNGEPQRYNGRMSATRCRVTYKDSEGSHSVEVSAETLYEAVAMAVAEFKADHTVPNPPGSMTEFTVAVFRPPVEHTIRLAKVEEWAQPSTKGGPAGVVKRERVRHLLGVVA